MTGIHKGQAGASAGEQAVAPAWRQEQCPLCESKDSTPYAAFPQLRFVQCAACAVVYKAEEAASLRSAEFYEAGYYTHKRSRRLKRFRHRSKKASRLLRNALQFSPHAQSVLDVGCAVGEVVDAAQRLGLSGLGCDVSQFAVDYCNERGLPA